MTAPDCLFCRIASGGERPKILHEDDLVVAFDVPPDHPVKRAPVHFIVVPRQHIASVAATGPEHEPVLGRLLTVAAQVAAGLGIGETGYRLATNTGPDANQTVFHLHLHCIGGRQLGKEG